METFDLVASALDADSGELFLIKGSYEDFLRKLENTLTQEDLTTLDVIYSGGSFEGVETEDIETLVHSNPDVAKAVKKLAKKSGYQGPDNVFDMAIHLLGNAFLEWCLKITGTPYTKKEFYIFYPVLEEEEDEDE